MAIFTNSVSPLNLKPQPETIFKTINISRKKNVCYNNSDFYSSPISTVTTETLKWMNSSLSLCWIYKWFYNSIFIPEINSTHITISLTARLLAFHATNNLPNARTGNWETPATTESNTAVNVAAPKSRSRTCGGTLENLRAGKLELCIWRSDHKPVITSKLATSPRRIRLITIPRRNRCSIPNCYFYHVTGV